MISRLPLLYFNPLPPHGGRRIFVVVHQPCYYFNPLPPHGGRRIVLFWIAVLWHFNPLPPHGGRPPKSRFVTLWLPISIHSLHTEGDCVRRACFVRVVHFNPLPPHGGRLLFDNAFFLRIHFNPLPPHGGRLPCLKHGTISQKFQSTPSTRRETLLAGSSTVGEGISIHSLHTEGDRGNHHGNPDRVYFNPLPPHGGRPH